MAPPSQPVGGLETRTMRKAMFLWCSVVLFVGAVGFFVAGVIWTNGTYGSRMGWLLGIVLPLLLLTAVFAWLASPRTSRRRGALGVPTSPDGWVDGIQSRMPGVPRIGPAKKLFAVSAALFAIPIVLGISLLLVYAALFVRHLLLH
jgi:hypothetical protein